MKNNNQPQLPFILEGNTAPRTIIRSVATDTDGLYKMSISQIRIRPKFNARRQKNIPEDLYEKVLLIPDLADGIFASNGPADPILGDIYKEDECFYITNGERRFRAINHLLRTGRTTYPNGLPVDCVMVLLNPKGTTDLERKRKVLSTQDNLKLTPMERAYYYLSLQRRRRHDT